MVTTSDLDFLTSDVGQQLLIRLGQTDLSEGNLLPLTARLRQTYAAAQANAVLTIAQLRLRAVEKFGAAAGRMYFTDAGLQQASHPLARAYRASQIGHQSIWDAGCGIGADSLAFAIHGADVLGVDIDPVCVTMARLNAEALGLDNAHFAIADVRDGFPDLQPVIFYDPGRRDQQGNRIFAVEHYIPPLSLVRGWRTERIVVKLPVLINSN